MDQGVIDDTIDDWRKRLRACVRAKGGHFEFEQLLKTWQLALSAEAYDKMCFVSANMTIVIRRKFEL